MALYTILLTYIINELSQIYKQIICDILHFVLIFSFIDKISLSSFWYMDLVDQCLSNWNLAKDPKCILVTDPSTKKHRNYGARWTHGDEM